MVRLAAMLLPLAIVAIGCGGEGAGARGPALFLVEPLVVQQTAGGMTISVWASPQPPAVGLAAFRFGFTDTDGGAVDGLDVDVLPWMPAHGHGGSTHPTATLTGPGQFLVDPVSFFMSGAWELRTTIGGARNDAVTVHVDVP